MYCYADRWGLSTGLNEGDNLAGKETSANRRVEDDRCEIGALNAVCLHQAAFKGGAAGGNYSPAGGGISARVLLRSIDCSAK